MQASAVQPIRAGGLALRACGLGLAGTGALVAAVVATGLVPPAALSYVSLGWGVAIATGSAGIVALAYMATLGHDHERIAQRYLLALVGNFLLQFLGVGIGVLAVFWATEKFPAAAAFGLTFAATATLLQMVGSVLISRSLRARARHLASGRAPTLTAPVQPIPDPPDPDHS